jgi:phage gp36-like protein
MPLETHVQNRISAALLRELTNPDNPSANAVNMALLQRAVEDVQADFKIYAGIQYDDTDVRHIAMAVQCVVWKLQIWLTRSALVDQLHERYVRALERFAQVTGRNRVIPAVPELEVGERARAFPPSWWNVYVPEPPQGDRRRKDSTFIPLE